MSTTAGLGSHEYVAVNTVAVVAVFAGIASLLALASDVLLIIPVFTAICAVIALAQIIKSNGTQTGLGLAALALLLAVGVCGYIGFRIQQDSKAATALKAEVGTVVDEFVAATRAGDNRRAYGLFGPVFQSKVKVSDFDGFLNALAENHGYGRISDKKWNGKIERLKPETDSAEEFAKTVIPLVFAKSPATPLSTEWTLAKRPSAQGGPATWQIEIVAPLFDSLSKQAPPSAGSPGGAQAPQ